MTKERIKAEIDKVSEEYLDVLYQIVKVFEYPRAEPDWSAFVKETYGCLADDPIERGAQGSYEIREAFE
jgi:hypothetical protein